MPYRYRFHHLAQEDYESSISWYIKRSLRAASNFVKQVDQSLIKICNDPGRYRNEYKNY